jgi:hypothetical protein
MTPHSTLRSGVIAALVAVASAVALSACGSSATTGAGAQAAPSATSTAPAPVAASSAASTAATAPTAPASASSSAVSTANFDSCSVVTQAEAASAIGQPVSAGLLGNATVEGGLACVFYGPSAPSVRTPNIAQPDSVRVVVVKGADALRWYNNYRSLTAVHAQPVAGFGDRAYYDGYASLSVLKGGYYLRIAISPPGAPPSLSDEKQLAAVILPKL